VPHVLLGQDLVLAEVASCLLNVKKREFNEASDLLDEARESSEDFGVVDFSGTAGLLLSDLNNYQHAIL